MSHRDDNESDDSKDSDPTTKYYWSRRPKKRSPLSYGSTAAPVLLWEGDDLERQHQRESSCRTTATKAAAAAVDLEQFRNYQIGKGYQAKHVIRQRTIAADAVAPVMTTTTKSSTTIAERVNPVKASVDRNIDVDNPTTTRHNTYDCYSSRPTARRGNDETLEQYLQCEAFRVFRKELDNILTEE